MGNMAVVNQPSQQGEGEIVVTCPITSFSMNIKEEVMSTNMNNRTMM
jgi:hypothetical protein